MWIEDEFFALVALIRRLESKKPEISKMRRLPPSYYLYRGADYMGTSAAEGVFASPYALYHLGIGKTVYCLKTAYYVYKKNWNIARNYIVFMPHNFLKLFEDAIDKKYRIPLIIWDDAGFWIGAQRWQSKFVRAVREFMNVIRTHLIYLMITAPRYHEVARGIREQLAFINFVKIHVYSENVKERRSVAQLFAARDAENIYSKKTRPTPLYEYHFNQYFEFYNDYRELREKYVQIGKQRAEEALKEIAEEAAQELKEIASKFDEKAKLDRIVEPEDLEDIEEELEGEEDEEQ